MALLLWLLYAAIITVIIRRHPEWKWLSGVPLGLWLLLGFAAVMVFQAG